MSVAPSSLIPVSGLWACLRPHGTHRRLRTPFPPSPAAFAARVAFLLAFVAPVVARADDYAARIFHDASGNALPYRILSPQHPASGRKYPLVFFFHGNDGNGTNNTSQLIHGARLFVAPSLRERFPCYVVFPQCAAGRRWITMARGVDHEPLSPQPTFYMSLAIKLLDALPRLHAIDTNRVYITGLSSGGAAVWDIAMRFPNRFAAAAPICGYGDEKLASRIAKMPTWTFHSSDDGVVPVSRARTMVASLIKAGGHPKYFEYSGLGHGCYGPAYREPEFLPWMFAQRRGALDTYKLKTPAPQSVPAKSAATTDAPP